MRPNFNLIFTFFRTHIKKAKCSNFYFSLQSKLNLILSFYYYYFFFIDILHHNLAQLYLSIALMFDHS